MHSFWARKSSFKSHEMLRQEPVTVVERASSGNITHSTATTWALDLPKMFYPVFIYIIDLFLLQLTLDSLKPISSNREFS